MKQPFGIILAGGLSRRLGGNDKGLTDLAGRPILAHVIDRTAPQVAGLALNANGDAQRFAQFGLQVVADSVADFAGPLAGILAGLEYARDAGHDRVVTVTNDAPFLPSDLVPRLLLASEDVASGVAIAATLDADGNSRLHPTIGLWPVALADPLAAALADGTRRVTDWTDTLAPGIADFPMVRVDPFFNINTPDDLELARSHAREVAP